MICEYISPQPRIGDGGHALISQPLRAGSKRNHAAVPRKIQQKPIYLRTPRRIFRRAIDIEVKRAVILNHVDFHADCCAESRILIHQRPLGADIVVDRSFQHTYRPAVQDILHIEDEVLTPVQIDIHLKMIFFQNVTPIQFVPENTVVKVRRVLQHLIRIVLPCDHSFLIDVSLPGEPLSDHPVEVGDHHVRAALLHGPYHQLGRIRGNPVVRIHELDILSPRQPHRLIACIRDPGILLVIYAHPLILLRILIQNPRRAVRAAIIHQEQLKILIFLRQNTVHAALYFCSGVIDRHDNRNPGHKITLPLSRFSGFFFE